MRLDAHILAAATQPIVNPIRRSTDTTASTSQPAAAVPPSLDTGQVVIALFAVLALILLLRWMLRKLMPGSLGRSSRGVRVIGRTYLAPKQQVLIVQVGRRLLVVGDSGQQLNTLCEITDPDEAAALLGQLNGSAANEITEPLHRPDEPPASESDPTVNATRTELNGLAQRVRMLARHLSKA